MDYNVKEQLIKSARTIKNKIKQMKNEEEESEFKFKRMFSPVIKPLEAITSFNKLKPEIIDTNKPKDDLNNSSMQSDSSSLYEDLDNADNVYVSEINQKMKNESINPITSTKMVVNIDKPFQLDEKYQIDDTLTVPFGVRYEDNRLMMGNELVQFTTIGPTNDTINMAIIGNNKYEMTPGIKELLFSKKPDLNVITEKDKLVYKDMLIVTNAHKRDYKSCGQLKGDKGMKYLRIIKPMFVDSSQNVYSQELNKIKLGGNIPTLKIYKKDTDFIYWDDPNELIERLKLLIASKNAGNGNHDNEIISIIEELKEAGIIKD